MAGLIAAVPMVDSRGFRRYLRLRRDVVSLTERNRQIAEENRKMIRQIEALRSDPKAVERAAREELGFVKPGELVINLE